MKNRRIALFLVAVIALFTLFSCFSFADPDVYISYDLTHISSAYFPSSVAYNDELYITLVPDSGFVLPSHIFVTPSSHFRSFDYNPSTGSLFISAIKDDVSIAAVATPVHFDISYNFIYISSSGLPTSVSFGSNLSFVFVPDSGYVLPSDISVKMGDAYTNNYSYDPDTGDFSIENVTGNIEITVAAEKDLPAFFKFFYNLGSSLFGTSGLVPQAFAWVTSSAVLPWFCVGIVISLISIGLIITKSLFWGR